MIMMIMTWWVSWSVKGLRGCVWEVLMWRSTSWEKQRRLQEVGMFLLVWMESYLIEGAWSPKSYFLETHKREWGKKGGVYLWRKYSKCSRMFSLQTRWNKEGLPSWTMSRGNKNDRDDYSATAPTPCKQPFALSASLQSTRKTQSRTSFKTPWNGGFPLLLCSLWFPSQQCLRIALNSERLHQKASSQTEVCPNKKETCCGEEAFSVHALYLILF